MWTGIAKLVPLVLIAACADGSNQGGADAAAENRLFTFLTVERWSRGARETYTTVGVATMNTDGAPPSMNRIDERCRIHEGPLSGPRPTHGPWTFSGGAVGTVTFDDDGFETDSPHTRGWKPGDMLTMSAAGATLPAVTLSAPVPEPVMLISIDMPTVPL